MVAQMDFQKELEHKMMKIQIVHLVQKIQQQLYQREKIHISQADHFLEQLIQPNGSFVAEAEIHQIQYHLIQFVLNYLILLSCFEKVIHVKLLMEEILFKLDLFCNSSFCFYYCFPLFFYNPFYLSWDDEDTNNGNSKSGALPDGVLNSDTTFYYCTYGPSFRILIIFFFFP